jgi:hypothetical protein
MIGESFRQSIQFGPCRPPIFEYWRTSQPDPFHNAVKTHFDETEESLGAGG